MDKQKGIHRLSEEGGLTSYSTPLAFQTHEDVAEVLGSTNLLLLGELVKDAGYDDPHLVSDVAGGLAFRGELREAGEFPKVREGPELSTPELRDAAKSAQVAVRENPWR